MCFEAKRLYKLALGPVLILMSAVAMAAGGEVSQINMSPGVTAVGKEIYDLHMISCGSGTSIGLGTTANARMSSTPTRTAGRALRIG